MKSLRKLLSCLFISMLYSGAIPVPEALEASGLATNKFGNTKYCFMGDDLCLSNAQLTLHDGNGRDLMENIKFDFSSNTLHGRTRHTGEIIGIPIQIQEGVFKVYVWNGVEYIPDPTKSISTGPVSKLFQKISVIYLTRGIYLLQHPSLPEAQFEGRNIRQIIEQDYVIDCKGNSMRENNRETEYSVVGNQLLISYNARNKIKVEYSRDRVQISQFNPETDEYDVSEYQACHVPFPVIVQFNLPAFPEIRHAKTLKGDTVVCMPFEPIDGDFLRSFTTVASDGIAHNTLPNTHVLDYDFVMKLADGRAFYLKDWILYVLRDGVNSTDGSSYRFRYAVNLQGEIYAWDKHKKTYALLSQEQSIEIPVEVWNLIIQLRQGPTPAQLPAQPLAPGELDLDMERLAWEMTELD